MSTRVCRLSGRGIYHHPHERRARASGTSYSEGVRRVGAQDTTGIVEDFEGVVTGVGESRGDLDVSYPVDIDVGSRGLDNQTPSHEFHDQGY